MSCCLSLPKQWSCGRLNWCALFRLFQFSVMYMCVFISSNFYCALKVSFNSLYYRVHVAVMFVFKRYVCCCKSLQWTGKLPANVMSKQWVSIMVTVTVRVMVRCSVQVVQSAGKRYWHCTHVTTTTIHHHFYLDHVVLLTIFTFPKK